MIDTPSALLDFVEAEDLNAGADELCGVILADGDVMQLPNIHLEPKAGFHLEPAAFLEQLELGAIGTWHTHPGADANLSQEDMNGFRQWPQLDHYIVGLRDGEPFVEKFAVKAGIVVRA